MCVCTLAILSAVCSSCLIQAIINEIHAEAKTPAYLGSKLHDSFKVLQVFLELLVQSIELQLVRLLNALYLVLDGLGERLEGALSALERRHEGDEILLRVIMRHPDMHLLKEV